MGSTSKFKKRPKFEPLSPSMSSSESESSSNSENSSGSEEEELKVDRNELEQLSLDELLAKCMAFIPSLRWDLNNDKSKNSKKDYLIEQLLQYREGDELNNSKRWSLRKRQNKNEYMEDSEFDDEDYESESYAYSKSSHESDDDDFIKKEQNKNIKIEYSDNVKVIDLSQYTLKNESHS